jgi:hypothetical protein
MESNGKRHFGKPISNRLNLGKFLGFNAGMNQMNYSCFSPTVLQRAKIGLKNIEVDVNVRIN